MIDLSEKTLTEVGKTLFRSKNGDDNKDYTLHLDDNSLNTKLSCIHFLSVFFPLCIYWSLKTGVI